MHQDCFGPSLTAAYRPRAARLRPSRPCLGRASVSPGIWLSDPAPESAQPRAGLLPARSIVATECITEHPASVTSALAICLTSKANGAHASPTASIRAGAYLTIERRRV